MNPDIIMQLKGKEMKRADLSQVYLILIIFYCYFQKKKGK